MVEKCYRVDVVNEELDRLGRVMMSPQDPMVEALTCEEEYFSQEAKEFSMAIEEAKEEEASDSKHDELEHEEEKLEEREYPIIVNASLNGLDLEKLIVVLRKYRNVIRCQETSLVLNWEKCHFMVEEGIVLGHKVSKKGIEVDSAKVSVISKLPPPTSVTGVRAFLLRE
ncbi:uncharacterized protein LOC110696940 [Chenopodium quinoa]|uniref:uncharacterized protein LOC110696940 n=1 Tax=Chenopodium quinoa TaxID=63459 RepID=UPI000B79599C|nr:uncharacterized protein LOC110696940 [Chenopodium quinoa]